MPQIVKTLTVNIDDATFQVEKMSPECQQLIMYFDEWRQEEADLVGKLLLVRAALQNQQNALLAQIRKEQDEAAAAVGTPAE